MVKMKESLREPKANLKIKKKENLSSEDALRRINLRVKKKGFKGNILHLYAEEISLLLTEERELLNTDITEPLLREIRRELKHKEIVKIQINAKPRMGKSTLGILLGLFIFDLLKKYYPEYTEGKKFGVRNIARDEQEFADKMRNPKLMYDIIVTDERNAMDETGENVTTEKAQKEMFSDVQAGRYVHNILISPEKVIDDNVDIRLVVRNREEGIIHCRVYYKLVKGGYFNWLLLGYANLDVSQLIKNWNKVERRFMKFITGDYLEESEREKDRKYVEYWRKKDFYVDYMYRKYEKMNIINQEGILRERDLKYADIYLEILEKTKSLAGLMSVSNLKRVARSYLETEFRKRKLPFSILGIDQASERVLMVLSMYKNVYEIRKKIEDLTDKKRRGKITEIDYVKETDTLNNAARQLAGAVQIQENDWERYSALYRKYKEII